MWLLSTDRAELHNFTDHDAVDGGYAILSHTWSRSREEKLRERTFQDLQALSVKCHKEGWNPRDHASEKIRNSCILAAKYGYRWIWIDTCCIDQTSSTELSEAINSMFTWYASAEVCFAYLDDVPTDCKLDAPNSAFRKARWHTRGWTLQELIAPQIVIFVSATWEPLGNKLNLAVLLSKITGIKKPVLTHQMPYYNASVAERMKWASKRRTTRIEDEAYCLLVLFNINMPTIYGEGLEAFQRLQQEIMKTTEDTSLFAWSLPLAPKAEWSPDHDHDTILDKHLSLLASSPSDFMLNVYYSPYTSERVEPYLPGHWKTDPEDLTRKTNGPFGRIELPKFVITNRGLECRFPITELDGVTVAVLLCEDVDEHLGLLLHPSPTPNQDPTRQVYRVGYSFERASARMVFLGGDYYNLRVNGGHPLPRPEWRDICIEDSRRQRLHQHPARLLAPVNCIPHPPFRIPPWIVRRLSGIGLQCSVPAEFNFPFKRRTPLMLAVINWRYSVPGRTEIILCCLGTCSKPSKASDADRSWSHWARVYVRCSEARETTSADPKINPLVHDCAQDHIEDWPDWTKTFGAGDRIVRLSFSSCSFTPKSTLVMHLELEGRVYEAMKETANATLPSRRQLEMEANTAPHEPASLRSRANRQLRKLLQMVGGGRKQPEGPLPTKVVEEARTPDGSDPATPTPIEIDQNDVLDSLSSIPERLLQLATLAPADLDAALNDVRETLQRLPIPGPTDELDTLLSQLRDSLLHDDSSP